MIKLLLLLPYLVVVGGHALVALALPAELRERGLSLSQVAGPMACYLLGSLGAVTAVVAVALHRPWTPWLAVAAAGAICLGPLWYGRTVGEFHLSHHLVRLGLVLVGLVLYFLYVRLDR